MRIAYFTESLLPLVDGVSLTLGHLFDTLERRGVDFRVFSPFVPDGSVPWRYLVRRVRSVAFPLYTDYRVSLPWGSGLEAELDGFHPDLVHVVSPTPGAVWAQRYADRRGIPVVATFHTNFVAYFRYYGIAPLAALGWRLLRRFYRRCAVVYVPSEGMIRELGARGLARLELWSRGVDAERFSPAWRDPALRAALGVSDEVPLLLMVSRLVKEKDLAELAPMCRILRERGLRFRLALVGEGPLRRQLERALPDAHFAGHRVGRDLSRWYASADVFVFPSTTETFGNVVQEALASGVPAVVSDRGGPQGVIRPGASGLVARANDPADFADKVGLLLRHPELRVRMGRMARRQVARRSWEATNEALLRSYRRVVEERRSPEPVRQIA